MTDAGQLPDAGGVVIADSVAGFSSVQGGCGWSYGSLPLGAEPFTEMAIYTTTYGPDPVWEESVSHPPWLLVSPTGQHPSATPLQWADRRWTSPVAGTIAIDGHMAKSDPGGGDGVIGHLNVDDVQLWTATIAYNDMVGVGFHVSATVHVGSTVDLLVDPNANDGWDSTYLVAIIRR